MSSWSTRGLRGSVLEEAINITNEKYRQQKLALVQKIPTPITPVQFDRETSKITEAYFEQRSTVDYIGTVQGIPVCFDAKECQYERFPLQNVHEHQMDFMRDFEAQDGISFFLIHFTKIDSYYYVPFRVMEMFWKRMKEGGMKSFRVQELDSKYRIKCANQIYIHYLETLSLDLESRGE